MKTYGEPMADQEGYEIKSLAKAVKMAQKRRPVTNDDDADSGEDPKTGSKEGQALPEVDPRKFVRVNPPLKTADGTTAVSESLNTQQIDNLIRLGLGDQDHLSYYRQALSNPEQAVQNPNLRKYVAEVLSELLNIVQGDQQMYNRLRNLLQNRHDGPQKKKIEDSLHIKAIRSGIRLDVLKEVYARGFEGGDEQAAFNRVNSFIAGGKARQMDADLLPDPEKSPGGLGSDEATKRYADMTPGQSFNLIKKALKAGNNG